MIGSIRVYSPVKSMKIIINSWSGDVLQAKLLLMRNQFLSPTSCFTMRLLIFRPIELIICTNRSLLPRWESWTSVFCLKFDKGVRTRTSCVLRYKLCLDLRWGWTELNFVPNVSFMYNIARNPVLLLVFVSWNQKSQKRSWGPISSFYME